MQEQQLIILVALVVLFLIAAIFLFSKNKKNTSQNQTKNEEKAENKRENFRIHVDIDIDDSLMVVKKIGSTDMNQAYTCKMVDISAGGAGVMCEEDFALKDKIFVTINFCLNKERFTFNGRIVRKIENLGRKQSLYGIQFLDMPVSDENRLIKEIIAIENNRRKLKIK